jgi:aminotransferase
MKVSNIANMIQPSLTRQLFDKAKEYDNVIDLTLGDPDYPTPQNVCEAGCKAIMEGKTKYTANAGHIELREAVARKVKEDTGIEFNPTKNVIITVGAMGALYLLIKSYINAGDEVIIPAPYWINYGQMVNMSGGKPIYVDGDEDNGFALTVEALEKAVTPRTKMIIINTPCNPTGEVYTRDSLEAIAKIAIENNLLVVSDEAYSCIVYDDAKFTSIIDIPGMKDRTMLVNSFSKRYSMTGWRVGYAVGDENIISAMTRFQENVASCCPQPSQYAALEALNGSQESVDNMVKGYQRRRDILVDGINGIEKLSCRKPQGTFYAFVNISETGMKSEKFAYALLDSVQVAVVPGITYGKAGDNYVRIAFTQNENKIKEAIERIKKFAISLN